MSESTTTRADRHGTVVIGAGVHGTYLTAELRRAGATADAVTILDPNPPLARFERRCRACGMETMRSPFVQHLGADPFGLETFAEATGRTDEIVSHPSTPDRPTVDLFFDHASTIVEALDLRASWMPARALDVTRGPDGRFRIATTAATLTADRVLLAIGDAGGPAVPDWVTSLPDVVRVETAWSGDERVDTRPTPGAADGAPGVTGVVGGGVSGVTLACALADREEGPSVRLFTRGPIRRARVEADPRWMNWRHVEERLHDLEPGDPERIARVRAARNDGTVPPPVADRFEAAVTDGRIDHRPVPVVDAEPVRDPAETVHGRSETARGRSERVHGRFEGRPPRLRLRTADGTTASVDALRIATGFDAPTGTPFVRRLAEGLDLQTDAEGYPVLDDGTLAWRRTDGSASRVFVSGTLASPTVGPFARNVIGARRAAERILDAPPTRDRYDPGVPA